MIPVCREGLESAAGEAPTIVPQLSYGTHLTPCYTKVNLKAIFITVAFTTMPSGASAFQVAMDRTGVGPKGTYFRTLCSASFLSESYPGLHCPTLGNGLPL